MKKSLVALLLIVCLAFGVTACQKPVDPTGATDPTKATSAIETLSPETPLLSPESYAFMLNEDGFLKDVRALDIVTLPDFKELVFSRADYAMTQDELTSIMEGFIEAYPVLNKERAVAKDDVLYIDYCGKMDGVAFAGGTAENQQVVAGAENFIDGFLTKIIGHYPGETFDINVTFPDPYTPNPDFSGKPAVFTVTIRGIVDGEVQVTDEYIAEHPEQVEEYFGITGVTTVEQLVTTLLADGLRYNLEEGIKAALMQMDAVSDYPTNVLSFEKTSYDISFFLSYQMTFEEVCESYGYTAEQRLQVLKDAAQLDLIVQAVAEKEKMQATQEDLIELYGDDLPRMIENYTERHLKFRVIQYKAVEYIYEHVTVTD